MLAGQILWDLWIETQDDKYFWKAIVQLTNTQRNSTANYQLRYFVNVSFSIALEVHRSEGACIYNIFITSQTPRSSLSPVLHLLSVN